MMIIDNPPDAVALVDGLYPSINSTPSFPSF